MALWEYKVIGSGKGGFASPALLESFLNQLGKEEWDIVSFHAHPDNPLAFHGLARRPTQREWTLEAAVAAAAKVEADKLRAEFVQRQHATPSAEPESEPHPSDHLTEKPLASDDLRKLRDTERDHDPDAPDEPTDDWDNWDNLDDDLPSFFDAIKPHMRKNQKGPGQAVALDFLARRWEQTEADLEGALLECGFTLPATEDDPPIHLEFEGDLFWINRNNRGALFINTREKPRPVFRTVKASPLDPADPAATALHEEHAAEVAARTQRAQEQTARDAEAAARRAEQEARRQEEAARRAELEAKIAAVAEAPLPHGEELITLLQPFMRRNRRGPGWSGSSSFLAKALKRQEPELLEALASSGLALPQNHGDKPTFTEIAGHLYWLNKDKSGGHWINAREAHHDPLPTTPSPAETPPTPENTGQPEPTPPADASPPPPETPAAQTASDTPPANNTNPEDNASPDDDATPPPPTSLTPLGSARPLLKPNKRGSGVSGEITYLARTTKIADQTFIDALLSAGLNLPPLENDASHKPVFIEENGEIFWLNRNAKDGTLWLNAKTAKSATKSPAKSRTPRPRKPKAPSPTPDKSPPSA